MSTKKFNFPTQHGLPFYFVSSSDGTNVVRVFKETIRLAIKNKEEPPDEVMAEIYALLRDDDNDATEGKTAEDYDDNLRDAVTAALGPSARFQPSPQMTAVAA